MSVINTTICPGAQTQCLGDFLAPLLAAGLIASFCPLLIWFTHTGLFARSVPIRRPLHLLFQLHGAFLPQIYACSLFPIRQQHRHHTPPFTQFYFLRSIVLLVRLFIYLLTLPVCLLHHTLWSTGAGMFLFSTSERLALRRVPGTEEVLSKHYLKE